MTVPISVPSLTESHRKPVAASLKPHTSIRVWTLGVKSNPEVWHGHDSSVYPVAFSPDGSWVASGSWDHTVRIWDAAMGESRGVLQHSGIVRTLAIS